MAKAGAEHGMELFWVLPLACIFTYVLLVAYGRYSLVTGNTALYGIRHGIRWGWIIAGYLVVALILGEIMALMGIMGIVADLIQEASRLFFGGEGWGTLRITFVLVVGLYGLLWYGRYQHFEKFLMVFVILMGLSFIIAFFMLKPNPGALLKNMIPGMPDQPGGLALVAAIAGTTCSAAVFIMRSVVVREKKWGVDDLEVAKKDAFMSASMMLFLSVVIMAVAASTLHPRGMQLERTVDLITLMEPLGGKLAAIVMIIGLTSAGISTVFPILLIAPWLISDFTHRQKDIHSPLFRFLGLAGILSAFGMQFMERRPPAMMIFSQGFQACILPVVVVAILLLINRDSLMKEHRAGPWMNVGLLATLAFGLLTSYFAIVDLSSI